jgi:hypothetical protein
VITLGLFAALLIGFVATAYYVWNHTGWASHELTWRVNQLLRTSSNLELSIDGVRGNPLAAVEVIHPQVRFRDGSGTLLEARAMTLRYSTWNLFAGRRGALLVEVDRPVGRLTRQPDGRLHLPEWKPSRGSGRPGRGFDYELRIRDGDLTMPDPEQSIHGFDLNAAVGTGNGTSVEIRSLSWKNGPWGMPLRQLSGTISAGDSVRIEVRRLESPPLALVGDARWKRGEQHLVLQAEVARVEWRWLARVFRNDTFDVPGEGQFSIRADRDFGWTGTASSHGAWDGLPIESQAEFSFRDDKLAIQGLSGRSPAGEISDGRLAWSKAGWELSGRAWRGDPSRWGVIGLTGWPQGDLEGRFQYVVDTRAKTSSRLEATLGPSTLAGWRTDSALVRVAFPANAPDSFNVDAVRRGGTFTLAGSTAKGGWTGRYHVTSFPLDEWADGRASGLSGTLGTGDGTVEGRDGGLFVTGTLEGRGTRWFGMDAARWNLDALKGRLLPTPELTANATLRDVLYLGLHFDSTATPVSLGNQTLTMANLAAWAGDTVVTMAANTDWDSGSWRLTADQAQLRSRHFDWKATEPVRLSGNAHEVSFERVVAQDGDARFEASGRWAQPGGLYDWQGKVQGLRIERLGLPDSLGMSGLADAELHIGGVAGDPRWDFRATCRQPAFQGRAVDSLRIAIGGLPGELRVDELAAELGDGWVSAKGAFGAMRRAWPDSLTPDGVSRWLAEAARLTGRVDARQVPLERATRFLGMQAGAGRIDGQLDVSGSAAHPVMNVALTAKPFTLANVRLDQVTARARYADDRLVVEQLRGTRDVTASEISGEMDVRLALGQQPALLDAPMRWHVDLPNGDLALLPVLIPQIGSAAGRVVVHGEVTGTPRHPQISGTASIEGTRLRFAARGEELNDVRARLSFDANRIRLDTLTAVQHSSERINGRVWAHGEVRLDPDRPHYHFNVSLRDFTASELGLYAARFDGDFDVVDGARVDGEVVPHITSDNVEIDRAVILYDFARQSEAEQVQASTQKLYWTYRIRVHATDNLRWQPPDGDLEFACDLNLDQSADKLVIFGDMEALRGTYYFLSNRFTVQRAKLTFDNVSGVDPVIDAVATTRLTPSIPIASYYNPSGAPATSSSTASSKPYDITVTISGRASQPVVAFDSQPTESGARKMDQAEILRELTVGRFAASNQNFAGLADPLDSYLTRAISRQLSGELSRAFRGYLTDWEIARESGGLLGQGGLVVGVGTQVNSRVALRYRQVVPGTTLTPINPTTITNTNQVERDIEAEYRINRFFSVTSQLLQKRTVSGTTTTVSGSPDFNVNLKARWEY